jgi:hypothetical protein
MQHFIPLKEQSMPENEKMRVEIRSVSLYPLHWATISSYAKDQGCDSLSAALRRIVDEWLELKKTAHVHETELRDLQSRFNELVAATTHALDSDEDGYDARTNLASTLRQVTHAGPLFDPAEISQIPGLRKGLR